MSPKPREALDQIMWNLAEGLGHEEGPGRNWLKHAGKLEILRFMEGLLDRLKTLAGSMDRDERAKLYALVRINNWCAQDLAENAYVGDGSGNYEKTLHGICDICRPFMEEAKKLKEYGGEMS